MPNWTINKVTMEGIGNEDLYSYVEEKRGKMPRKCFDFDKLIPEPKTKEELISKYGERYLNNDGKHLLPRPEKPWFDWYGWHTTYWGTKWNACDSECRYSDNEISFYTAWSEPEPIWEALSLKYPDRLININADYEDGFICSSEWLGGKKLWEETIYKEAEEDEDKDAD